MPICFLSKPFADEGRNPRRAVADLIVEFRLPPECRPLENCGNNVGGFDSLLMDAEIVKGRHNHARR